jgi:hypothetical protein
MRKLLSSLLLTLWASVASANVPCSLPFNLQNNTIADATQVMANYNALVSCLGNAAIAGVNNDITALFGLTQPITQTVGGTWIWVGGTSTGSANAQVVATLIPSTGFSLVAGKRVAFVAGFTNSGAATLNAFSTGNVNIFKQSPSGPVALTGNEIATGNVVEVEYDGTQYQILNPGISIVAGWGISISGTTISQATTNPAQGFNTPVNFQLNATVATNNLTVAIKNNSGSDPSATNPVLIPFRDVTPGNGDPVWLTLTAANSFQVNAGSTFGVANNIPFRLWIVAFNDASTVRVGLINASASSSTVTTIFPLNEFSLPTSTACNACGTATLTGTFYTTQAVSTKAFRILGYLEYNAGLATAGTFNIAPTGVQLFGPGVKKPGDIIQEVSNIITASDSTNSATFIALTNARIAITPSSQINPIRIEASGTFTPPAQSATTQNCNANVRLSRGTTNNTNLIGNNLFGNYNTAGAGTTGAMSATGYLLAYDLPGTVSATTYTVQANIAGSNCGTSMTWGGTSIMTAKEIQG